MHYRLFALLAVAAALAGCGSSASTPTPATIVVEIPTISLPTLRPAPTADTFVGVQPPGPEFGKQASQQQAQAQPSTAATAEAPAPTAAAQAAEPTKSSAGAAGSLLFPLTADAADVRDLTGDGTMANYSSKLSPDEIMGFYRKELGKAGAVERELLTVKTGDVFSMVFDNWQAANGKAVVIQGTPIAPGTMNVNIRLEAV